MGTNDAQSLRDGPRIRPARIGSGPGPVDHRTSPSLSWITPSGKNRVLHLHEFRGECLRPAGVADRWGQVSR